MQKVSFEIPSDKVCRRCGKFLKQNLVNRKPTATHCYTCWKKVKKT
jgi:hypothetical protein